MSDQSHLVSKGSLGGAILLIAGCCIGAGMLGLPVMSSLAGFTPSLVMFVLGWLFMTTTALLLLEVNLWFKNEVSIISMADRTLGKIGKGLAGALYIFLFYALGIAYISASGELISLFFQEVLGTSIPHAVGGIGVSILFGGVVYLGTRPVDLFNRFLMAGLIISYLLLVIFGAPHVKLEYLRYSDWSMAPLMFPIMIISFGYHNLIPSLKNYLHGDIKRLRLAIILGSAIPLMVYLIWEFLILGLVPLHGEEGFLKVIEKGEMATDILNRAVGSLWVTNIAQYFAFFAVLTSFLGNSLSFVDFLADGLGVKKDNKGKICLCLLVIAPSLLLSLIYPHLFLIALNYAGAFGAVTLFGILPALMVWSGRYQKRFSGEQIIPGGRFTLVCIILFGLGIIILQIFEGI